MRAMPIGLRMRTRLRPRQRRMGRQDGLTLPELLLVLVFLGILTSVAIPTYSQYAERARINQAIAHIRTLDLAIERFRLANDDRIPDTLDELGVEIPLDPWGQPYRFLNFRNASGKGEFRKDRALNPLNTDYDLYSIGADGDTKLPLPPKESHDDVLRANDGVFVGLGKDY